MDNDNEETVIIKANSSENEEFEYFYNDLEQVNIENELYHQNIDKRLSTKVTLNTKNMSEKPSNHLSQKVKFTLIKGDEKFERITSKSWSSSSIHNYDQDKVTSIKNNGSNKEKYK